MRENLHMSKVSMTVLLLLSSVSLGNVTCLGGNAYFSQMQASVSENRT